MYVRPYDPRFPQVCMDEVSKQLLGEKRPALPMEPGHAERQDYEYERHGVCNIFLACEPLAGKRYTQVTTQRTKVDWARFIREVVDVHYPHAEKIVLVSNYSGGGLARLIKDTIPNCGSSALSVLSLQPTLVECDGGKYFLAPPPHLRGASSDICFRSHWLVLRSSI